jgi:hypothetical protein
VVVDYTATGPTAVFTIPTSGQTLTSDTPRVTWTLTAGTQWRYRIIVNLASDGSLVYDSDWIQDADARSHVIPPGYLADTTNYTLVGMIDDGAMRVTF